MKRFFKTTAALFKKDFKDAMRNPSVGILLLMPVFFSLLLGKGSYSKLLGSNYILMMTTAMCLTMIPISYLATIIAEEKEKNTLRTLMLAGVSAGEFISSKILLVWLLMQIVNFLDFVIIGLPLHLLPMFLLITTFGSVCLLMFGAVIGIVCRNQMTTSLLSVPLMMFLIIPTIMSIASLHMQKIAELSPVEHVLRLFSVWAFGPSENTNIAKSIIVILTWTAVSTVLYLIVYRKKRLDV